MSVPFTIARDTSETVRFAPLRPESGRQLLERYTLPTDDMDTFMGGEDDSCTAPRAALEVFPRLDFPWPLCIPSLSFRDRYESRFTSN